MNLDPESTALVAIHCQGTTGADYSDVQGDSPLLRSAQRKRAWW